MGILRCASSLLGTRSTAAASWALLKACRFEAGSCGHGRATMATNTGRELHPHADKIHLKGLVFHGYHGAVPEENVYGQKFKVDATLYCDLRAAGTSDNLEDTFSYADVYRLIKGIVEGPHHMLLESVADKVAQRVLEQEPKVHGITVYISKPQVHLEGVLDSVGVEITRRRQAD